MQLAKQYVIKVLLQLRCKVTDNLRALQYLKYVISYPYDGITSHFPNVFCEPIPTFSRPIPIIGERQSRVHGSWFKVRGSRFKGSR